MEKINCAANNCLGFSCKKIAKWLCPSVIIAAFALGFSYYIGAHAVVSCLWAITVNALAFAVSIIPFVFYSRRIDPQLQPAAILAVTVIRLLTIIAGLATIILFTNVNVLWFVLWVCLFYIVVLVMEACFAVRIINRHNGSINENV